MDILPENSGLTLEGFASHNLSDPLHNNIAEHDSAQRADKEKASLFALKWHLNIKK